MPGQKNNFRFQAILSDMDGPFIKTAILLPESVVKRLPKGRVRVKGFCNDAPFALAVQHRKDGSRYFSVSASLRKAAGIRVGDVAVLRFQIVDPDKLDVPEELEAVLSEDDEAKSAWDKLTTGYQRGLIHYITSVKNVDSRIKRAMALLDRAKMGKLHGQKSGKQETARRAKTQR